MAPVILRNQALADGLSKLSECPRRAYVTFLAGDGDYVKGVVGLSKGLRKVASAYPLVVALLPDVPLSHCELLASHGCIVRQVDPLPPPANGIEKFERAYYAINYSKLRIWDLVEYNKMYLDSDIQVFENIDDLFDLPDGGFYAVIDCCKEKTWSFSPEFEINYCRKQRPDQLPRPRSEAGDSRSWVYFNAGFFVFEPSIATSKRILAAVETMPPTAFAEQDFLNVFFKDVFKPVPLAYSFLIANLWLHPENVELEKVKAVHYCAPGSKPWKFTRKEEHMDREDVKMLVNKWCEIYNDDSLNYVKQPPTTNVNGVVVGMKEPADAVIGDFLAAVKKEPKGLRAALSKSRLSHYIGCVILSSKGSQDRREMSLSC